MASAGTVWRLVALNPKLFKLTLKNLSRNLLRTLLTAGAIVVLVGMITIIWTIMNFIDKAMAEKFEHYEPTPGDSDKPLPPTMAVKLAAFRRAR